MPTYDPNSLAGQYQQQYEEAKAANLKRYDQALAIYDEIIARYRPGGSFGKSALAELESQKGQYIGRGTQDLISSGLYGTSMTAGLGGKFEKEIGAPSRLKLEDLLMERLSSAQMGKIGFMESREDMYPDMGQMASLFSQASQASPERTFTRTYGGTYGASSFPDMFSIPGESGGGGYSPKAITQSAQQGKSTGGYSPMMAGFYGTAALGATSKEATETPQTQSSSDIMYSVPGYGSMTPAEYLPIFQKWVASGKKGTIQDFMKSST